LPWDKRHIQLCDFWCGKIDGDMSINNLANSDAVDAGGGLVTIPTLVTPFVAGSYINLSGTTNYDGDYVIQAVGANDFTVYAPYVAEEFVGLGEVVTPKIRPGCSFRVLEVRLHLDDVGDDEAFEIILAAGNHAYNDITLDSQNMNGLTQHIVDWSEQKRFFNKTDSIYFTHANTLDRAWGLEVKYAVFNDISH